MKLILARHGNTFEADETPVWVGKNQDYPLVQKGREQAQSLSRYLIKNNLNPEEVYCGFLSRTSEYAQIICDEINDKQGSNLISVVENRLNEIDYGLWGGKSNQEIIDQFGKEELDAWNNKNIWPSNANWQPSEEQLKSQVISFCQDLSKTNQKTVLIISSNGRLRYFLQMIPGEFEKRISEGSHKVATGNICILELGTENKLLAWDQSVE